MKSSIVDLPVSGSISKSQIDPAKDPPTFLGLIEPFPAIDPPVFSSCYGRSRYIPKLYHSVPLRRPIVEIDLFIGLHLQFQFQSKFQNKK